MVVLLHPIWPHDQRFVRTGLIDVVGNYKCTIDIQALRGRLCGER
jgi:uncharacterized lipoprotein YddW (UPF0748 family)